MWILVSLAFFLNLPNFRSLEPSHMIVFGQPSRFKSFGNILCAVPLVGMPYYLVHPKCVQYTWPYPLPCFYPTEDLRVSVNMLTPNRLYLNYWSFVWNWCDRLGFATVWMPCCVVTSNVCCAVSRVHTQFLASLSGLILDIRLPVTVDSM